MKQPADTLTVMIHLKDALWTFSQKWGKKAKSAFLLEGALQIKLILFWLCPFVIWFLFTFLYLGNIPKDLSKKSNTHPLAFFMAPSKTNTIRKCWQRRDPPTTNLLINIINSICRKRKKRTSQEKEDQKLPLLQGISSLQLPDWEITTISQIFGLNHHGQDAEKNLWNIYLVRIPKEEIQTMTPNLLQ